MKYIPGFQFVVGSMTGNKQPASLLERQNKRNAATRDTIFIPGESYKIYNIKLNKDNVTYYFIQGSKNNLLEIQFNNIQEAEMRIGKLIGE